MTLTLAAWLHDLSPFAIRFSESFGIRWYGLAYASGFVVGYLALRALARRGISSIPESRVIDLLTYLVMGVVAGGRLGYVLFYQPSLLWTFRPRAPWWGLLAVNEGGMSSHGGMIGVIVAAVLFARGVRGDNGKRSGAVSSLHILDLAASIVPVGMFLGRLANFVNGELLGKIVAMPGEASPWWSVKFPQELLSAPIAAGGHAPPLSAEEAHDLAELERRAGGIDALLSALQTERSPIHEEVAAKLYPLLAARHPSQLYQAFFEGPVLLLILWWVWRKPRTPGVIGAHFFIWYGVFRVATEFIRLPDTNIVHPTILGLSRGQWLSVAMILVGFIGMGIIQARARAAGIKPLGGWSARGRGA